MTPTAAPGTRCSFIARVIFASSARKRGSLVPLGRRRAVAPAGAVGRSAAAVPTAAAPSSRRRERSPVQAEWGGSPGSPELEFAFTGSALLSIGRRYQAASALHRAAADPADLRGVHRVMAGMN